ncbi:hypothetical protein PHMEG_00029738 [Phytophthora megakarya]|uniref:Uncharacterized protein n=1 Tax=Phytophthora megakarya TaxID=4795 RepID=A0A225V1V5_9STRA|nr:hypothetical protein PHMEG_00029738 [Phytophthora megakarya]
MKIRIEAVDANNVTGTWKIVHLNGSNIHNHLASRDPSFHPGHRRRDMERLSSSDISHTDLVAAQTAVGVSTQVVVATIRSADPDTAIIAKYVSNKKNAGRREALTDDTPTELLLKKLDEHKFFFKVDVDKKPRDSGLYSGHTRELMNFTLGILTLWLSIAEKSCGKCYQKIFDRTLYWNFPSLQWKTLCA